MKFHKYQGTGNDFIMIDRSKNDLPTDLSNFVEQMIIDRKKTPQQMCGSDKDRQISRGLLF